MGDRFYAQQKAHKPKRRLKKDIITDIQLMLDEPVDGLEKCTVATLEQVEKGINHLLDRISEHLANEK